MATLGQVGNAEHANVVIGKAGRSMWLGRRPKVWLGNESVDHPHGGGEGKTGSGRHPVTPWGKPTKGYKTRKHKKSFGFDDITTQKREVGSKEKNAKIGKKRSIYRRTFGIKSRGTK